MSIFSKIKDAIFGSKAQATQSRAAQPTPKGGSPQAGATASSGASTGAASQARPGGTAPSSTIGSTNSAVSAATQAPVDVEEVLGRLAATQSQKLNWRSSIVDLMKLVGLDPSLDNRRELARELGYTGDTNDSASMNIWLHKKVMQELATHGGKVPAELKD